MVYCPSEAQHFRFFNPHYENDGAVNFFDYCIKNEHPLCEKNWVGLRAHLTLISPFIAETECTQCIE